MPLARKPINLYDTSYKAQFDPVHQEVREETYGLDLGQTSWMTAEELEEFIRLLVLTDSSHVLEVGCGAGGCAVHIAQRVGAKVTGIDVNEHGIAARRSLPTVITSLRHWIFAQSMAAGTCRSGMRASMLSSRTMRCATSQNARRCLESGGVC